MDRERQPIEYALQAGQITPWKLKSRECPTRGANWVKKGKMSRVS